MALRLMIALLVMLNVGCSSLATDKSAAPPAAWCSWLQKSPPMSEADKDALFVAAQKQPDLNRVIAWMIAINMRVDDQCEDG